MEMASFRKLFRSSGTVSTDTASDNIQECTPSVRRSIKRAKDAWGVLHFACINGVVRNVFVHPDSPINKRPEAFIIENLGLFDLKGSSITVKFEGDKGTQLYKGKAVPGALIFREARKGEIPTPVLQGGVHPVSTRDLERAAGVVRGEYIIFELGLADPKDINPGARSAIVGPQ